MSEWYEENDDSEQQADSQETGKGLRGQLEKALRERDEARKKSSELGAKFRRAEIAGFLRDNGWSPKVAKYVPPDVDPTTEALNKWVEEEGAELFGLKKAESESETPTEQGEGNTGTAVPPDVQDAFRQISATASAAHVPQGKEADQLAHMLTLNDSQLREYLQANGAAF